MGEILQFIGACVLAGILLAIPTLIPISIMFHWNVIVEIYIAIFVAIEILLLGFYIFDSTY